MFQRGKAIELNFKLFETKLTLEDTSTRTLHYETLNLVGHLHHRVSNLQYRVGHLHYRVGHLQYRVGHLGSSWETSAWGDIPLSSPPPPPPCMKPQTRYIYFILFGGTYVTTFSSVDTPLRKGGGVRPQPFFR